MHFHSALEIYFILNGEVTIFINGNHSTCVTGDIGIINPHEAHSYHSSENAEVAVLILSNHYLADFYAEYKNKNFPSYLCDKEYNKQIYELLADLPSSIYDNDTLSMLGKKGLANLVLDKIVSYYGVVSQTQNEEIIINVLKYLHKNYKNKITLEDLAKQFGYATNSMSRILRKYLSVDFRIFLNNIRAEQVHLMLNNSDFKHLSVLQIAYACGFDSAATFYRSYKRNYGKLPTKRE